MKTTKIVTGIALMTIMVLGTAAQAEKIDLSGFEVMTPDEYLELVAGKTITGVHRGNEYTESYTQDKRVNGKWGGSPFSGRWTAGKNNCVLITYDMSTATTCWKLLHKDGKYIYG